MIVQTDVLVIGAGTAGLRSALAASDGGAQVLVVSKKPLQQSGVTNADVAEMAGFNAGDGERGIELHYQDIIDAGQHVVDPQLARVVAEGAPQILNEMIGRGVPFEREDGKLFIFKSCFSKTARTHVVPGHGSSIAAALRDDAATRPNISVLAGVTIIGLLKGDGVCTGAWGLLNDELVSIHAKATILASGGGGLAFERSFSPSDVAGGAYEMAWDAGAVVQNLEFMQIGVGISHPLINIFNGYLWQGRPTLIDGMGQEIFSSVLPKGLTAHDVFDSHIWHYPFSTRDDSKYLEIAINRAVSSGRGAAHGGITLDMRHMSDAYVASLDQISGIGHMWPLARDFLRRRGVDLLSQTVEVACFQHAMNGGVKIDVNGQSTIEGLYAVGECAGGPHGADRLGGNMFVTSLIFGKIAGAHAAERAQRVSRIAPIDQESRQRIDQKSEVVRRQIEPDTLLKGLQHLNQQSLLVDRTEEGLTRVIEYTESIQREIEQAPTADVPNVRVYDLMSIARTSWLIAQSAQKRKESRGSHHRADYPNIDSTFNAIIEQSK